mmetsp:Transcript_56162/g.174155  ORF Transcript_56162/g.174155 Transcript_56162/m.174155 type:complete len:283 (-) Transcript_56162:132-980(-)
MLEALRVGVRGEARVVVDAEVLPHVIGATSKCHVHRVNRHQSLPVVLLATPPDHGPRQRPAHQHPGPAAGPTGVRRALHVPPPASDVLVAARQAPAVVFAHQDLQGGVQRGHEAGQTIEVYEGVVVHNVVPRRVGEGADDAAEGLDKVRRALPGRPEDGPHGDVLQDCLAQRRKVFLAARDVDQRDAVQRLQGRGPRAAGRRGAARRELPLLPGGARQAPQAVPGTARRRPQSSGPRVAAGWQGRARGPRQAVRCASHRTQRDECRGREHHRHQRGQRQLPE